MRGGGGGNNREIQQHSTFSSYFLIPLLNPMPLLPAALHLVDVVVMGRGRHVLRLRVEDGGVGGRLGGAGRVVGGEGREGPPEAGVGLLLGRVQVGDKDRRGGLCGDGPEIEMLQHRNRAQQLIETLNQNDISAQLEAKLDVKIEQILSK